MAMKKGRMPDEPIGVEVLYDRKIEEKSFSREEFDELLSEFERDLDDIVENRLSGGEFSLLQYNIEVMRADTGKNMGCLVSGGSVLTVGEGYAAWSLANFRNLYKTNFQRSRERVGDDRHSLNIVAYVEGARDHTSKEVDVFDSRD